MLSAASSVQPSVDHLLLLPGSKDCTSYQLRASLLQLQTALVPTRGSEGRQTITPLRSSLFFKVIFWLKNPICACQKPICFSWLSFGNKSQPSSRQSHGSTGAGYGVCAWKGEKYMTHFQNMTDSCSSQGMLSSHFSLGCVTDSQKAATLL